MKGVASRWGCQSNRENEWQGPAGRCWREEVAGRMGGSQPPCGPEREDKVGLGPLLATKGRQPAGGWGSKGVNEAACATLDTLLGGAAGCARARANTRGKMGGVRSNNAGLTGRKSLQDRHGALWYMGAPTHGRNAGGLRAGWWTGRRQGGGKGAGGRTHAHTSVSKCD